MFVLQIVNDNAESSEKTAFLKQMCRNIANTMYRPDPETYLRRMRAEDLGLDPSDLIVSSFGNKTYRSLQRKVSGCDI